MKTHNTIFLLWALLFAFSCSEKELAPITNNLGKPGIVTDIKTESIPGGVKLSYRIPENEDLLEVKAIYQISTGKTYETTTSFYDNNMTIYGFNDTHEHELQLYAVNRAQEMSDPVTVKFTPLESSLSKSAKSMFIIDDFGGAQYRWENPDRFPLNYEFLAADSIGKMFSLRIISSEALVWQQSMRGFDVSPRMFAVIVRDNYGNASDTIYSDGPIYPFYEEKLHKNNWRILVLDEDESFDNYEAQYGHMIDDDLTTFGHSNTSLPSSFTIDIGAKAKLSRLVLFQRFFSDKYYNWGNPKTFKVYGSPGKEDGTAPAGNDWSSWPLLFEAEISKPSGMDINTNTDEDLEAGKAGHEFMFDIEMEPLRYVRIQILSTWGNTNFTHPAEFDLFGEWAQ